MPKIKTVHGIANRKVVSQKQWVAARKKLLVKEKKFSKLRDEMNLQRRKLPWVKVEKEYVFNGPAGRVTLADLFGGKSQLWSITSCSGRIGVRVASIAPFGPTISTA
jgi:predicted dithiol-disulfide oxidoreductase (DUF899 family)